MTAAMIEPAASTEAVEVSAIEESTGSHPNRWSMPLDTKSEDTELDAVLQVDVDSNDTKLYDAITSCRWDDALVALKENPKEARTWVVRYSNGEQDGDSLDTEKTPDVMWRFLPIHSACARQPPLELISALLEAFPNGALSVDDQGMHSLHYACGNQASREVVRALLLANPDSASLSDPHGMLPIHYLACWGPSSVAVIDMVLVAHRDVASAKDADGKTPLDLAKAGTYPSSNTVVEAITRWIGDEKQEVEGDEKQSAEADDADDSKPAAEEEAETADPVAQPVSVSVTAPQETAVEDVKETAPESEEETEKTATETEPLSEEDIADDAASLGATSIKAGGPVVPGDMDSKRHRQMSVRRHRSLSRARDRRRAKATGEEKKDEDAAPPRMPSMDAGVGPDDKPAREITVGNYQRRNLREQVGPSWRRETDEVSQTAIERNTTEDVDVDEDINNSGRTHRTVDKVLYCPVTPKPSKNTSCGTMTIEYMTSPRTVGLLHDEIDHLVEEVQDTEEMWAERLADMEDDFRRQMEELEDKLEQEASKNKEHTNRIKELESEVKTHKSELADNVKSIDGMSNTIKNLEEERNDLRQTLTELSSSHDDVHSRAKVLDENLGSINETVGKLIAEQTSTLSAVTANGEQMVALNEDRRSQLEELMRLEDDSAPTMLKCTTDAKACLANQIEQMKAMASDIATLLQEE